MALLAAAAPGRFVDRDLPADLAAMEPTVAAVVSVVGPSDLGAAYEQLGTWMYAAITAFLGCDAVCPPEALRSGSPITMVGDRPPPALLVHGELDTFLPAAVQGEPLARAWRDAGGEATVWVVAGTGHNVDFTGTADRSALEAFLDGS